MIYKTYYVLNTDAYILHTKASGEADKVITLITKENEILNVFAKSIRKENAKMRCMTKPYAKVKISIITARKNILKNITIIDANNSIWNEEKRYTPFVHMLKCVQFLIPITNHNEEKIFSIIEEASSLFENEDLGKMPIILTVAQSFILKSLGYIENENKLKYTLKDIVQEAAESKNIIEKMKKDINNAMLHI